MLSRAANYLPRLSVTLCGDGAGVDDVDVAMLLEGTNLEARRRERLGYRLGLILRDLAPESV
jgi:hypothetical protein